MATIRKHWKMTILNAALLLLGGVAVMYGMFGGGGRAAALPGEVAKDAAKPKAVVRKDRPLDPAANEHVKSVVDAAHSGRNPERLSPLIAPHRFDLKAYQKDSHAYVSVIEPGRVWDTADEGPGVKPIGLKGPALQHCPALGSVSFTAVVAAGAPVTFTTLDGGAFQNGLTTITLQADAKGEATATFTATEGTIGTVNMLAACPLTTGQIGPMVLVEEPAAGK